VQVFADETIDALPLDAIGHVAHWGGEKVTLHEIMVHKTVDLQRHAGHADILREQLDGSVGLLPGHSNLPDATDWPTYTQRLTAIANRFTLQRRIRPKSTCHQHSQPNATAAKPRESSPGQRPAGQPSGRDSGTPRPGPG
jgi:hypothetical protein